MFTFPRAPFSGERYKQYKNSHDRRIKSDSEFRDIIADTYKSKSGTGKKISAFKKYIEDEIK